MESYKEIWISIQICVFLWAGIHVGFLIWREWKLMNRIKEDLNSLHKGSSSADLDRQINQIFSSTDSTKIKYAQQWKRYFDRVSQKNADERIRVEPYLGADVLNYHMGYRAWVDVMGGIFVSLGVLGTFIGLVFGLAHLDLGSTDTLKTSIRQLLSGMESAFYTSIMGIGLSICWTVIDRFTSARFESLIDWHAERLNFLLNADDEELFLNRLEKVSRNQADHLKTLLTDALENAMRPIKELMQQQVNISQHQTTDITKNLVEQITGGTDKTIQSFSEILEQTQSMQTKMLATMDEIVERYRQTERQQSDALDQFNQMSNQFRKIVDDSEKMSENFSHVVMNVGIMQDQLVEMQSIQQKLLPELTELRSKTNDVVMDTLEKSEYYLNRVEHQINEMQTHWQDASEHMKATRDVLNVSVKDFAENIDSGLSKTYNHFDNTLTKAMQNMAGSINRMHELQEELIEVFEELGGILTNQKEAAASTS